VFGYGGKGREGDRMRLAVGGRGGVECKRDGKEGGGSSTELR